MYELTHYEEAKRALAICVNIDEVRDIASRQDRTRLYAQIIQDTELELNAAKIRLRAQIRLGEMIAEMETAPSGRASLSLPIGGKSKTEALAAAGISTSSAHRYEQAAKVPEAVIENYINESAEAQKPVTLGDVLRAAKPLKPKPTPEPVTIDATPAVEAAELVTIGKAEYDDMRSEIDDKREALQEFLADAKAMEAVLDADDQVAEAAKQIRMLTAQVVALRADLVGKQNKENELIKIIKSLRRQVSNLEKDRDKDKVITVGGLPI